MSTPAIRGGAEFSDIPLSGSLAQSKPWRPRHTEQQAHGKDQKEPRTWIQSQGGNRSN
jgi:hypothetical protein